MRKVPFIVAIIFILLLTSCKKDEGGNCTTCSSPQTADFQVCEEGNGNASVNGQNTGTPYETYISGLVEAGANCQ
tara:strand:+ start:187 stop:411 length:225 start_codon:yes stop_codon:yes gene_type:complete